MTEDESALASFPSVLKQQAEMEIKCAKANEQELGDRVYTISQQSSVLNEEELSCQLSNVHSSSSRAVVVCRSQQVVLRVISNLKKQPTSDLD